MAVRELVLRFGPVPLKTTENLDLGGGGSEEKKSKQNKREAPFQIYFLVFICELLILTNHLAQNPVLREEDLRHGTIRNKPTPLSSAHVRH